MKNKFVLFLGVLISFVTVYSQLESNSALTYLKANLEYLASDELEGREVTKRGEDLAAMFIASELKKYGVEPFGDEDSYFQKIDIRVSSVDKTSSISFKSGNKKFELSSDRDFLIDRRSFPIEKNKAKDLEMIFVNYGIVSEEYEINDYENLDVEGKVVVVFDDMPDDDRFSRTDRRTFGTWSGKRKIAMEQGAAAVVLILSEEYYDTWDRLHTRMYGESFGLNTNENEETELPTIAFSAKVFEEFFKNEKYSFEELLVKKEDRKDVEPFILNNELSFEIFEKSYIEEAQNVVGIIKGNSEKLADTYVAVTAHYDHVGINNGEVYNGADDNGSGTVTILEAARQLALRKENDRSILFIFHTGEEKGLLGSKYLTNNVTYVDSIVANINMDMVGRGEPFEIYCIGSGKLSSQFYDLVKNVNERTANFVLDYKFDAEDDPNRYYYRSDHYQYAKQNIPVVFFFDEMKEDYHKPTDDVEKINFEKLNMMSELTAEIALEVSNLLKRLVVDKN